MCIAVLDRKRDSLLKPSRPLFGRQVFSPMPRATPLIRSPDKFFARGAARSIGDVGPLDIVVRSLTSPNASRVLRDFVQNDFIDPLAKTLNQPSNTRAALIASFLTGLSVFRSALCIESLLEAEGSELEHRLPMSSKR